jgi:type I restriction enzyme S subunit
MSEILPFNLFFKNTTPKPYQIEKKDYLESGKYPVVDQGKKFIVGYSNQEEKLFKLKEPIIIFGDHTRIIKYIDFDFIIGADGTKILFSYDDSINTKYAYYQLLYIKIESLGYSRHYKLLKEKTFQKPPLIKQKQIAKTLDKAKELIELRKESINKLDELSKSIFIDMFGDPVSNPMEWDTSTIEEIVKDEKYAIKRGPFGGSLKKDSFVPEGYLVYEQFHALNNDFSMQRYFINEKKFDELKAFEVKAGDIIISCSGVYLGKLAIVPNNSKKGIINQALLKISLDENKMKKLLFLYIFRNNNFKSRYFGSNIGSGVPNFPSMFEFKKFSFITPPIEIQKVFISRIKKIEQQKTLYQEELKKLQENFDSLLAQSFKA